MSNAVTDDIFLPQTNFTVLRSAQPFSELLSDNNDLKSSLQAQSFLCLLLSHNSRLSSLRQQWFSAAFSSGATWTANLICRRELQTKVDVTVCCDYATFLLPLSTPHYVILKIPDSSAVFPDGS